MLVIFLGIKSFQFHFAVILAQNFFISLFKIREILLIKRKRKKKLTQQGKTKSISFSKASMKLSSGIHISSSL